MNSFISNKYPRYFSKPKKVLRSFNWEITRFIRFNSGIKEGNIPNEPRVIRNLIKYPIT
jgi:hypothetical protein